MRRAIRPRRLTRASALAVSLLLAALATAWSLGNLSLSPPGLKARQIAIGTASTHVMLKISPSLIADRDPDFGAMAPLVHRATLYGDLLTSRPVREAVAARLRVPASDIATSSRITAHVERAMREPDEEKRANQIFWSRAPYRIEVQANPDLPILHVFTQAPTAALAIRLADESVSALRRSLSLARPDRAGKAGLRVELEQLGSARGAAINGRAAPAMGLLTFLVTFLISMGLQLAYLSARAGRAPGARPEERPRRRSPLPRNRGAHGARSAALPRRAVDPDRPQAAGNRRSAADWPHTTRVLPWTVAGFTVVVWLLPFNVIELSVDLPFDLKLDRLILPLIVLVWVLAMATGAAGRPRLTITPIHVAIAVLIAVSCVGVVLNQHSLNRALEFDLALKKLTLLFSYGIFFAIVASVVRRSEVPSLLKLNLGLAVACALGMIWEYRLHYNPFYSLSDALLPGLFEVGSIDPQAVDEIGRRMTRGPAEHPLESAAMLAMALPIAIVGVVGASRRRPQLLYGLAACILLAAVIATYRKTALFAVFAVVATVVYFRRRELLRLAPLGLASLVAIHALSPGAFGSVLAQLRPSRLAVSTVSDRTADYDAIRPDLWSNLAFGRGYGTYDHTSYRVLDSEVLSRLVDSGVLGLAALVSVIVAIVAVARPAIAARDPERSPPALAIAAAAAAFLTLAFLFDVTSFPHTPYILMSLAGLLAVSAARDPASSAAPAPAAARDHGRRPPQRSLITGSP